MSQGRMPYNGVSQGEALANLTSNITERLRQEGLGEATFQALGVDVVAGQAALKSNLTVPEAFTPRQRERVMAVTGEECTNLRQQRFGVL